MNGKAWNNKASILSEHFVGFLPEKEKFKLSDLLLSPRTQSRPQPSGINRDCRGRTYSLVRGEILRSWEDELLRKHSTRMSSLIKNESVGIEDDQIPS